MLRVKERVRNARLPRRQRTPRPPRPPRLWDWGGLSYRKAVFKVRTCLFKKVDSHAKSHRAQTRTHREPRTHCSEGKGCWPVDVTVVGTQYRKVTISSQGEKTLLLPSLKLCRQTWKGYSHSGLVHAVNGRGMEHALCWLHTKYSPCWANCYT